MPILFRAPLVRRRVKPSSSHVTFARESARTNAEEAVTGRGTALVTGASSGIGRAMAHALVARGAELLLSGRDRDRLERDAASLRSLGQAGHVAAGDLNDAAFVERLCQRALDLGGGRLSLLVCCAASHEFCSLEDTSPERFEAILSTNVRAPFLLVRALLPALRAARGDIVFVNSSAALHPRANVGAYAASKAALRALADCLRAEVNPDGVRVLSVFPGRTATPMQAALCKREGRVYHPERLLQPGDVAESIMAALQLPSTAELTDLHIRPRQKS